MKSLEKDRTRRYETASGFARDIENFLNDEPVEACPPSAGYRLRKFARKYRAALATALSFAAILVLGAVASIWQAIRATQSEGRGEARRTTSDRGRGRTPLATRPGRGGRSFRLRPKAKGRSVPRPKPRPC